MGNRSAADADGLLEGRGPGTGGGGAGTPGAAAALAGGVLLIGAVLAGNALVCVSVAAERALQTPTNYFIVSLAAADLLLALLVLPLFVYSEVSPCPRPNAHASPAPSCPVPIHREDLEQPGRWAAPEPRAGAAAGTLCLVPGQLEPRSPLTTGPPNSRSVYRLGWLAVHPPSSVPLFSCPVLASSTPERLCPSSQGPQKQATLAVQPPTTPSAEVPLPRGARWKGRSGVAPPPPALPGAQRHIHITAQSHSQA